MPFWPILALIFGSLAAAGAASASEASSRADEESRKRKEDAETFRRERQRMEAAVAEKEERLHRLEAALRDGNGQRRSMAAEIVMLRAEVASLRAQLGRGDGPSAY